MRNSRRRGPDLTVELLGENETAHAGTRAALALFRQAEEEAVAAITWYLRRRKGPSRWSRVLRATATALGVAGGVAPLVHGVSPGTIEAEWGFVFLALGAGCVLFDRIFGFSSSWTRFVRTELALQRALKEAQGRWTSAFGALPEVPTQADAAMLTRIAIELRSEVQELIEDETLAWTGYLAEGLEELTRSTGHDAPPGAAPRGTAARRDAAREAT
ncbi:SLATT domain-containing protein [Streptomyces sp. SBT349]|uniref:SLATT domain-containing protein n=1 Tax=Streptomyces sp. SBT349 TaxID=1580539 RepID=UPI00066B7D49|nr:SLATT domain-containing protein [Streptomyces sp. SBT349]